MITALFIMACSQAPLRTRDSSESTPQSRAPHRDRESGGDSVDGSPYPGSASTYPGWPGNRDRNTAAADAAASRPDDVWARIRDHLRIERHAEMRQVRDKLAWYRRNQDYLDRVVERARPYLYYIVEKLERRQMPLDLALLPIVESAYQPFAQSPSRASGIWQFIPSTGRRYGLKQNWWYDGRRDIVAATDAALDYLQKLHAEFDGDWLLALAAYNTGERNVARAVSRNRSEGRPSDFFNLRLHGETRGYVPSLLAVAELIARPERYGVHWRPIPNRAYFELVDLGGQIDLATAASLAGMSMDEIYTLNPGFNRWATDPDGPHRLVVPVAAAERFSAGLAALPESERVYWVRHEVRPAETLGAIAARYNSSVEALKLANRLRGDLIRVGQSLLIPGAKESADYYTLSEWNRRYRNLQRSPSGQQYIYTVKRGDTLWDIGRQYGVSVSELTAWNGLTSHSILRPGQNLELWLAGSGPAGGKDGIVVVDMQSKPAEILKYTVRKGDSLWLIARRFSVSILKLQTWNRLARGSVLYPGQVLIVYRPDEQVATGA